MCRRLGHAQRCVTSPRRDRPACPRSVQDNPCPGCRFRPVSFVELVRHEVTTGRHSDGRLRSHGDDSDVHDRGRQRHLHRIPPSAQRVLRRGLHPQPDAHGQGALGVGDAPTANLPDQPRDWRLTRGHTMRRLGSIQPGKVWTLCCTGPWPLAWSPRCCASACVAGSVCLTCPPVSAGTVLEVVQAVEFRGCFVAQVAQSGFGHAAEAMRPIRPAMPSRGFGTAPAAAVRRTLGSRAS